MIVLLTRGHQNYCLQRGPSERRSQFQSTGESGGGDRTSGEGGTSTSIVTGDGVEGGLREDVRAAFKYVKRHRAGGFHLGTELGLVNGNQGAPFSVG